MPLAAMYTQMVFLMLALFPYHPSYHCQNHHNVAQYYGGRNACHHSSACPRSHVGQDHNSLPPRLMIVLNHLRHIQYMYHQRPLLRLRLLSAWNLPSESATQAGHIILSFGKTCLGLVPLGFPAPSLARPRPFHLITIMRHAPRDLLTAGSAYQYSSAEIHGLCRWFSLDKRYL